MVLSDRTIRRLLEEGRIGIEPYAEELLQPSSVDVRVDRYFRVFHNARYPFIDVKQPQEELTELVDPVRLAPAGPMRVDAEHREHLVMPVGERDRLPGGLDPRADRHHAIDAGVTRPSQQRGRPVCTRV